MIVAIKGAQRFAAAGRPVFAVDQEDIEPSVAIGIEERRAGTQCLREKLLPCPAAVVHESNSGLLRDVGEANGVGR